MQPNGLPRPLGNAGRLITNTELMGTNLQQAFPEVESGPRRRVWCKGAGCHHQLYTPESRLRGYGPVCDPDTRNSHQRHDADQDPIPGLWE